MTFCSLNLANDIPAIEHDIPAIEHDISAVEHDISAIEHDRRFSVGHVAIRFVNELGGMGAGCSHILSAYSINTVTLYE